MPRKVGNAQGYENVRLIVVWSICHWYLDSCHHQMLEGRVKLLMWQYIIIKTIDKEEKVALNIECSWDYRWKVFFHKKKSHAQRKHLLPLDAERLNITVALSDLITPWPDLLEMKNWQVKCLFLFTRVDTQWYMLEVSGKWCFLSPIICPSKLHKLSSTNLVTIMWYLRFKNSHIFFLAHTVFRSISTTFIWKQHL